MTLKELIRDLQVTLEEHPKWNDREVVFNTASEKELKAFDIYSYKKKINCDLRY